MNEDVMTMDWFDSPIKKKKNPPKKQPTDWLEICWLANTTPAILIKHISSVDTSLLGGLRWRLAPVRLDRDAWGCTNCRGTSRHWLPQKVSFRRVICWNLAPTTPWFCHGPSLWCIWLQTLCRQHGSKDKRYRLPPSCRYRGPDRAMFSRARLWRWGRR